MQQPQPVFSSLSSCVVAVVAVVALCQPVSSGASRGHMWTLRRKEVDFVKEELRAEFLSKLRHESKNEKGVCNSGMGQLKTIVGP